MARQTRAFISFAWMIGTPEEIVARLREYEALGVEGAHVSMHDGDDLEPIAQVGETVIAALSDA